MRALVFGQAKSGTTALMRSLSDAMGRSGGEVTEVLEPENLNTVDLAPDPLVVKKLFGPHDREEAVAYPEFDHRLFIVRDPRDRIISSLLYDVYGRSGVKNEAAMQPFLDLLESKEAEPRSVSLLVLHHVYWKLTGIDLLSNAVRSTQRARSFWRNQGTDWTLVKYEDFVAGNTESLAKQLGVDELTQPEITGDLARVSRTNAAGSWRHWLTPADQLVLEPATHNFLNEFGYDIDWKLNPNPVVEKSEASGYVRALLQAK